MFVTLSAPVRECLAHAQECADRAEAAPDDETREDFLLLEKSRLKLAIGYDLAARLSRR